MINKIFLNKDLFLIIPIRQCSDFLNLKYVMTCFQSIHVYSVILCTKGGTVDYFWVATIDFIP